MKTSAVICEYNPFHAGHTYHLRRTRETADAVIAVMSGSFTERGTPAVISKYERARVAVLNGADLVLELPFPFCSGGAEVFARGGIGLTERLGVVDALSFGSESGDASLLSRTAERLNSEDFRTALQASAKENRTLASGNLFFDTVRRLYGEDAADFGSNDILGLAYMRELAARKSRITPEPIRRIGNGYNETDGEGFLSASGVRESLQTGVIPAELPEESRKALREAMENGTISSFDALFLPYVSYFRTHRSDAWGDCPEGNAEIFDRLCSSAVGATDLTSFFEEAKTKTYSFSRLYRAALFAFLQVGRKDVGEVSYTRVLAANATGRRLLHEISRCSDLPIITKSADYLGLGIDEAYELGLRADALWLMTLGKPAPADALIKTAPVMAE
ncbi:MAG: nucleotidyltransferase family protein [Ruminococcus sp.]|nr:nucleotidyltransferase family protein [Candidatus Apopatosoma intestinale]